jgi:threonylcarbamoyladenosine tRNA methylthiotransferase MtaB
VNVYFHTFGCRANQYDTDVVRRAFAERGAVEVADPALADLAVINSCTVTAESEVKLRRFVRHIARTGVKETVVMGCAAALDDGAIAALPSVRAVVANADVERVIHAAGLSSPPDRLFSVSSPPAPLSSVSSPPAPLSSVRRGGTIGKFRALLKIQDGCDEHCTFCATTIARGDNRSRSVHDLIEEARALAAHHAEIVLTGVHIGGWGLGIGDESQTPKLGQLVESLITAVPHVRFRLSSVEATEVDDTLARLLIEAPRHLAAHLHAPLQSGSNPILKRMGRHWYTADTYRARIDWLAERLPVFGLGADVIAGFPGETDADHHASLTLLHALPFTYLHVFPFSVRPDAPAARLDGQLPGAVIRERAREIRALGESKAAAYRGSRRGGQGDGVVSGRQGGKVEVLTEDYLTVHIPSEEWGGESRFVVEID